MLRLVKDKEKDVKVYNFLVIPIQERISDNPEIAEKKFEIENCRFEFFTDISKERGDLDDIESELLDVQDNLLSSLTS